MSEQPHESRPAPENIAFTAVAFEGGLAIVALVLGLLLGHSPLETVGLSIAAIGENVRAVAVGLLGATPMMLGLIVLDRVKLRWFDRLSEVVQQHIVPLFHSTSWTELAIISLAAGIGEEMLFRGLAQTYLAQWIGPPYGIWIGLGAASLVFGACHWITNTYAVLATGVGIYFGWLLLATDNLLAPIAAHAAYDMFALAYLVKWKRD